MRKKHEHSVGLSEETKRNIYFYHHSIEDHIESLAEQAGNKNLVAPITAELVRLLEAKALWETFRNTQSLPEMWPQRNGDRRGRWPRGAARAVEADLSGNAPGTRSLSGSVGRPRKGVMSKEGREAVSRAQRKRWAKVKAGKRDYGAEWARRKERAQRAGTATSKRKSETQKSYWSSMTPEQRSAEMERRYKVRIARGGKPAGGWVRGPMTAAQRKQHSKVMKAAYARKRAAAQQDNNSAA